MEAKNVRDTCTCGAGASVAANVTDHVWTMKEFLLFLVPPWRQEVTAA